MNYPNYFNILFYLLSLSTLLGIAACGENLSGQDGQDGNCIDDPPNVIIQERSIANFSRIDLQHTIDVVMQEGSAPSVEVHAGESVMDLVKTEIEGETLNIFYSESVNGSKYPCNTTVYVTFTNLAHINTDGTGDLTITSPLDIAELNVISDGTGDIELGGIIDRLDINNDGTGDIKLLSLAAQSVTIDTDGTGDINLDGTINDFRATLTGTGDLVSSSLTAQTINLELGSTGDVALKGTTNELDAKLTSNGDFESFNLVAQDAVIITQSNGDAEITVEQTLDVTITSNGDVSYKGNPQITQSITGNGDLIDAN